MSTSADSPDWAELQDRLDHRIRTVTLLGLDNAELIGEPGQQRVGEWADWILDTVLDELRKTGP
ncbi:hypothetical protein I5Q34_33620 [Streptomyces sp. AV19]|uniref:hypothetical protein n=1 Tax=Streptomyces sp. AV19 TaxID=2793068 RepID=UPI0018FE420B|nr:hypothetical protein [Streptomyces sp. AV19]MBH1939142.1 hypothetical protein [Streptomyces sp. AV19]MDG4535292.1 hypothetical protein [Streptomyces sp. AV19]